MYLIDNATHLLNNWLLHQSTVTSTEVCIAWRRILWRRCTRWPETERVKYYIYFFFFVLLGWWDHGLLGPQFRTNDLAAYSDRSQTSVVIKVNKTSVSKRCKEKELNTLSIRRLVRFPEIIHLSQQDWDHCYISRFSIMNWIKTLVMLYPCFVFCRVDFRGEDINRLKL